jgi:hypothetical protein
MCCNTQIGHRTYIEIPSKTEIGKTVNVLAFKRNGNLKVIPVELSDGSYAYVKVCEGCEKKPIDNELMEEKFKDAWEKEDRHSGLPESEINKRKEKVKKLKVKGRRK